MLYGELLHFLAVGIAASVASLGVSMGQAMAASGILQNINRQPNAINKLNKLLFYGLFLVESSFILSFLIAFLILFKPDANTISFGSGLINLGAALGMACSAISVGLATGVTIKTAANVLAKQPNYESKLTLFIIVVLTLIETPVFFMFVIALLAINHGASSNLTLAESYKLFAATLAMGIGVVGPSIAQMFFAKQMCLAVMHKIDNFNKIFSFAIITEALVESCALFSFIVSIFLIFKKVDPAFDIPYIGLVFAAIALCVSLGSSASAIGIAMVGRSALLELRSNINLYGKFFQSACMSQALIETCGLFALIISLILMLKITF